MSTIQSTLNRKPRIGKNMLGITSFYKSSLTCEKCTIPLKLSEFNNRNIVFSLGNSWASRRYCAKCAILKGLCTEQDLTDFIQRDNT